MYPHTYLYICLKLFGHYGKKLETIQLFINKQILISIQGNTSDDVKE